IRTFQNYSLSELVDYIDWTPFFISWNLAGKYPEILRDETVGEAATQLYQDARQLLDEIISHNKISANAVIGFWPANTVDDDDILVQATDGSTVKLHHIRQQQDKNTPD